MPFSIPERGALVTHLLFDVRHGEQLGNYGSSSLRGRFGVTFLWTGVFIYRGGVPWWGPGGSQYDRTRRYRSSIGAAQDARQIFVGTRRLALRFRSGPGRSIVWVPALRSGRTSWCLNLESYRGPSFQEGRRSPTFQERSHGVRLYQERTWPCQMGPLPLLVRSRISVVAQAVSSWSSMNSGTVYLTCSGVDRWRDLFAGPI